MQYNQDIEKRLTKDQLRLACQAYENAFRCYKWVLFELVAAEMCCDGDNHLIPVQYHQSSLYREFYKEFTTLGLDNIGVDVYELYGNKQATISSTPGLGISPLQLSIPNDPFFFLINNDYEFSLSAGIIPEDAHVLGFLPVAHNFTAVRILVEQ